MHVVTPICCGLDVHKRRILACLVTPSGREVRTFGTLTSELRDLAGWLQAARCQVVGMESTGVFWKPVYNILEAAGLEPQVINAHHIQGVPGRKTDVKDCEWIADLVRHGLVRPSYIPDRWQRELQELVRYRRSLVEERAREANRIQKVLEGANSKLASVISNVLGVSGRAMLEAMAAGTTSPHALAAFARPRLRATTEALEAALEGEVGSHQRLLLSAQLRHIHFLGQEILRLEQELDARLAGWAAQLTRLMTIPGISRRIATELLAVLGPDLARFPTAGHLASWAKLGPGLNESGGKRRSGATGHGNALLRTALTEAAWAASHTKDTSLAAQFHRLAARRGKKRALIAVVLISSEN